MSKELEKKIERCRFAYTDFRNKDSRGEYLRRCEKEVTEDNHWAVTDEARCELCEAFKSRYIEYPITVNGIENSPIVFRGLGCELGSLVAVRPCDDEYGKKTYLGFYLGDLPLQNTISFNDEKGILKVGTYNNPAMFVPELGRIIWGCGSWWHEIKSVEELREITDDDISNVWYVKMAKALSLIEDTEGKEVGHE